ncbi:MAG TPA: Wzz/FepE/Etk N-terminal domain-containing protein [Terriglobia bacterium]|nr:Wzz/FepE/Etk N-terminal domain-containing protein [Terriglobia bacterium]
MNPQTVREDAAQMCAEDISMPSSAPTEILDILIVLSKRLRLIVGVTLGAAIVTAIIVLLMPNKYTAAAVVLPPAGESVSSELLAQLSGSNLLSSLAGGALGIKKSGDMYVALFRSRTVEDALIRRFGLMARFHKKTMVDTRTMFEKRSTAVLGVKDGLIRVTFTDRDPKFAADVVNAYVDEFRKHSDSMTVTEASQRRAFFQQQLLEADANLAKAEQAMKTTEQTTGVLQLDSQAKALIESAAILRAQVAAKEVQLQSMRAFVTESNPQYIAVQQQLDALDAQLAKVAGPGANAGADIGVSGTNVPKVGMAYLDALRDVRYYETIDELLAKQFELAKLDEARQGAVEVSDAAIPPDKKSSPYRALIVVLMTIVAFVACILWVLAANRWEQAKRDPEKSVKIDILRRTLFGNRE